MTNNEDITTEEMLKILLAKSDALDQKLTNIDNKTFIPCWATMN